MVNDEKPHRGRIDNWTMRRWWNGTWVICGKSAGHPQFDGHEIHTSRLVALRFDDGGNAVQAETKNSVYDLGEPRLQQ